MIEIVGRLFGWKDQDRIGQTTVTDLTVYKIETNTHSYSGQIVFQDDVKLKIKTEGPRVIKVLKQNIQRIVILKPESNTHKSYTRA